MQEPIDFEQCPCFKTIPQIFCYAAINLKNAKKIYFCIVIFQLL